jgi:ectoine hydroxylase-related dioxygenase (phytanoyl-CoA dioxygenase family)
MSAELLRDALDQNQENRHQQWLQHLLGEDERATFRRDGYIKLPGALNAAETAYFTTVVEEMNERIRAERGLAPHETLNLHDVIGSDARLFDLIDWPTTFPKVWGLMGWNIQLYHTQMINTPPRQGEFQPARWGWHQDNNRMNRDIVDVELQPMISLKVAYFLSDVSQPGRGNFAIVPRSQHVRQLEPGENGDLNPGGTLEILGQPGDAVIFDRRLWHAGSHNWSEQTRKVLFYGYSHRWLRPKCAMDISQVWNDADPIRRQLLGHCTGANGYYDPQAEDVPLREWMKAHLPGNAIPA